jgi:hypothetical protein
VTIRAQAFCQRHRLAMRGHVNSHSPPGLPVRKGLPRLLIHQTLMLYLSCLGVVGHRGARVHPLLFERIPPVKREIGWQLLPAEHLADNPFCLTGRVCGAGIEEDAGAVRRYRDAMTEPAAHVVLQLMVAQGPDYPLGIAPGVQGDRDPPIV